MADEQEPSKQFSVRLPPSVIETLDRLAREGYRNRTQELTRLIMEEAKRRENTSG